MTDRIKTAKVGDVMPLHEVLMMGAEDLTVVGR